MEDNNIELESLLVQNQQIGEETNGLLETIIQQNEENNPETILEASVKVQQEILKTLGNVQRVDIKGDKGDDGYTPQKGKDYFTDEDINEIKQGIKEEVTPIKGIDYVDGKDGKDGNDGEDGYTPQKGKDYFTDKEIKEFKSAVTPIKGKDYFDGKDAEPVKTEEIVKDVVKKLPDINKKIESEIEKAKEEIRTVLPTFKTQSAQSIEVFDEDSKVTGHLSALKFKGDGVSVESSGNDTVVNINTATGIVEEIVEGANISVDNTDPANPIVSAPNVEPSLGNPPVSGYILSSTDTGARSWIAPATGGGAVDSVFGRTGDVVAEQDDYTFEQIDKTNANIVDIPLRSHNDLQDIGVNLHTDIDNHIGDDSIHFTPKTEGSVVFAGPGGVMDEDNDNIFWDNTAKQLRIGGSTNLDGDPEIPITVTGNGDLWTKVSVHNQNSGPAALSVFSACNDISGTTLNDFVLCAMGIASSGSAHPVFQYLKPNDSFLAALGGDLILTTVWPTKKIKIATGGSTEDNVRMYFEDDKTSIIANKEAEIIPELEAANWTATNGWSAGSGQLVLVSDIDDSTIQPNPALTITAGNTYEVKITCTGHTGTVGYTLGGVAGSEATTGSIDEYITALTTDNFIITGIAGSTCTITSISIRELVADTGNLLVEGDIILGSKLSTTTGAGILAANGDGVATFNFIPLLPAANPTLDNEAVRKGYVDAVVQGLYPTFNCRLATTVAGTLATSFEEGDTIDTKTLVAGDIILIKNQVNQVENGFYEVNTSGAPTRLAPFEAGDTLLRGTYTSIEDGSTNLQTSWVMYLDDATVGTDPILFRQNYVSQPPYTGSNGITVSSFDISVDLADTNPSLEIADGGLRAKVDDLSIERTNNGLQVIVDDSSIEIDGTNGLQVKTSGVTNAMLAGSIEDSKLNTISTAGKVDGSALDNLDNIPNTAGVIPIANLATGTPDGTKFVRDDGTLAVPPGAGATGVVESIVAGDNITVDDTDPANPIVASTGGVNHITISGTINDSNTTFTALSEPLDLVINGATYAKTGGAITWTYSSGTIELSSPVGTGGSIYGIYSGNAISNAVIYVGATEPANPTVNMIWFS